MGYANVHRAIIAWPHLDHRAARCLLVMANTARDRPGVHGEPAGVYWGGHELLAHALGLSDWDQEPSQADRSQVRRVLSELVDAGAVKPLNRPRSGVRAEYLLALSP